MVSYEAVYEFIKKHYKHDRFEGRNGPVWSENYSHCVVRSHVESLEKYGYCYISQFESKTGDAIKFDAELNYLPCRN